MQNWRTNSVRLIESDAFPFEFLSLLAERESWRKEIHRPIYHLHKWWAKRLGSVFRGILLGCVLPEDGSMSSEFYKFHSFSNLSVFDPFMGSGTTIGEAHKLGFTAIGRDINPVAVSSVRTALGPMSMSKVGEAFADLSEGVGAEIRGLYRSEDSSGRGCDVLYFFWVMQAECPNACGSIDLFPSWIIARNAYPDRKPQIQVLCPSCGDIFPALHGQRSASCRTCGRQFDPSAGPAMGAKAHCGVCGETFKVIDAIALAGSRPAFRLYGKLVLTGDGLKEYLPATAEDAARYEGCPSKLVHELEVGRVQLPTLELTRGYNTRQAMSYLFKTWRDFFNDRQLLALGRLRAEIARIADEPAREPLLTLFSGVLEFNNLFASYKGEGTGAVRHMFSHHILRPERTPIEANVWGTPKSSGSFSNLFRSRLVRAAEYRSAPTEVSDRVGRPNPRACSPPFSGVIEQRWPDRGDFSPRAVYLSRGDSAVSRLPEASVDLIVTDPPFFDNVHYSELADFFYAWQQLTPDPLANRDETTRDPAEVQDSDAGAFAGKLRDVFRECRRVLKDDGLVVFTYHHSREEGWESVAAAVLDAGLYVVNAHPVKAEMSGATPKSQAKEPIQLDMVIVCRKMAPQSVPLPPSVGEALEIAKSKLGRLQEAGFLLSRNDRKVVRFGQLLSTLRFAGDFARIGHYGDEEIEDIQKTSRVAPPQERQRFLLGDH